MRKIDKKNKISFNVFGILIVAFLAVFAVTGINVLKKGEQEYHVATGSVVYDENMSRVDMASSGTAKKKWDGKYYLSLENGGNYCLGTDNVMYDTGNGELSVLGDGHQVFTDGSIRNLKGKTIVENQNEISFFKLDDRNYLFCAPDIRGEEQGFVTENYVQVNLDKAGNALLTNDEVNMKTVEPMTLSSGDVIFDIPNEQLIYKEQKVDLKAINGSTNEYEPPEEPEKDAKEEGEEEEEEGSDADNTAGGSIVNNTTSNNSSNSNVTNNSQDVVVNGAGAGNAAGGGTAGGTGTNTPANLERTASLRGTQSDVTSITVNYYIMDPESKFVSTYLLVSEEGSEDEERIGLSKADTSVTVRGLKPNTQYRIALGYDMYVVIDGESELSENTEDIVKARTKSIASSVRIDKITADKIHFTVELDASHLLDEASVNLYGDDETTVAQSMKLTAADVKKAARGGFSGTFSIAEDWDQGQYILAVENARYQGEPVTLNARCITKNSGITRFIDSLLRGFN